MMVLDMSIFLSGPMATQILAGLGADVIKVEAPAGDPSRGNPPFAGPKGASVRPQTPADLSFHFLKRARNKRSVVLNLKEASEQNLFLKLAARSDVIVENFRPGTADRLGVGYNVLKGVNPGLIYCSISGFGLKGPYSHLPALDIAVQAMSGLMSINGDPGGPPIKVPLQLADMSASLYAVIGILAALQYRKKTGEGQLVEVSMLDTLMALLLDEPLDFWIDQGVPARMGNRLPRLTPYSSFPTADGHIVIASPNNEHWQAILEAIGRTDLAEDPRFIEDRDRTERADEVDEIVTAWSSQLPTSQAVAALVKAGVPCAPVRDLREAFQDPALEEQGAVVSLMHPTAGMVGEYRSFGLPIKFSKAETLVQGPVPFLGEHTAEVLASLAISANHD
jgi:formyl-CoA transferase